MKRLLGIILVLTIGIVVAGGWFVNRELQSFLNLNVQNTNTATADASDPDSWQFAVIGDTEDVQPVTTTMIEEMGTRDLELVVHVGDIASHGDPTKMREVKDLLATLPFPAYYIPGNNDLIYDDALEIKTLANYKAVFGDTTYQSFDVRNAHFVLLDNSYLRYGFSDEELDWLADDLEKNTQPITFLFFHRPLHLPGEQLFGDDETPHSREQNEKFLQLIAKYPITHIFNGHIHIPVSYTLGETKIPVTVTGGGGALPQEILGGEEAAFFHYDLVTVGADDATPTEDRISF